MKILHLASFDRWTGAAAPAFSEVEALRRAGVDAHYGYVGGSTLGLPQMVRSGLEIGRIGLELARWRRRQ